MVNPLLPGQFQKPFRLLPVRGTVIHSRKYMRMYINHVLTPLSPFANHPLLHGCTWDAAVRIGPYIKLGAFYYPPPVSLYEIHDIMQIMS